MTNIRSDSSTPPAGSPLSQRRWLLGGVAASAALIGVGVSLWRTPTPQAPPPTPLDEGFWSLTWDSPQGEVLTMQSFRGQPLLLNFWATWCPPCVEELPLINAFYRQNRANGWQVLGLAVDKLLPVQAFLEKTPLDFPIAMAGLDGAEVGRGLGNLAGGLPFSVVLGREGLVLHRKLGRLSTEDLTSWLRLK